MVTDPYVFPVLRGPHKKAARFGGNWMFNKRVLIFFIKRRNNIDDIKKSNTDTISAVESKNEEHQSVIDNLDNDYNNLINGKKIKKTKRY